MKSGDIIEHYFYHTRCLPDLLVKQKDVWIYKLKEHIKSANGFVLDPIENKKDIPLTNIEIEALRYWGNIFGKGFCTEDKVNEMVEKSFKANKLITIEEAIKD